MIKTVHTAVYPVQIVISTSLEETNDFLTSVGIEPYEALGEAFVLPLSTTTEDGIVADFLLLSFHSYDVAMDASILVHEITHIKNLMAEFLGLQFDKHNDEWEAYLNGYLFNLITDVVRHVPRSEIQTGEE